MEKEAKNIWPQLEAEMGFTQAIRHGDTIYVSGAIGIDEAGKIASYVGMARQIKQAYENLNKSLDKFGASLRNVVAETIYVTNMDEAKASGILEKAYDGLQSPARTIIEVDKLAFPSLMVEITCIARI